jgi:hypothetical protein
VARPVCGNRVSLKQVMKRATRTDLSSAFPRGAFGKRL